MDKPTRTCVIDGCSKPFHAKGWCRYHYKRAYVTGDPLTPRQKRRPNPEASSRKPCAVIGCPMIVGATGARGYCATHYSRWRRSGSPGGAERMKQPRGGSCSAVGCGQNVTARGLCHVHYGRMISRGSYVVACEFCGVDLTNRARARRFCSAAHAAMSRRHEGVRPKEATCSRCGDPFSLLTPGKSGRTKRADAKMCPDCRKARSHRHGWSVKAIVAHAGSTTCGICSEPVDLKLRKPDAMSPSIDHIVPFAHGGSNDIGNLQLAHLHCNQVKSDSGWKRGKRVSI